MAAAALRPAAAPRLFRPRIPGGIPAAHSTADFMISSSAFHDQFIQSAAGDPIAAAAIGSVR
jgi:hypothetical protein